MNVFCVYGYTLSSLLRLDAGTFGTMGVGCGFAIAAALVQSESRKGGQEPDPVFCIQGDSAFGFSGMELETASRSVRVYIYGHMTVATPTFWQVPTSHRLHGDEQ